MFNRGKNERNEMKLTFNNDYARIDYIDVKISLKCQCHYIDSPYLTRLQD